MQKEFLKFEKSNIFEGLTSIRAIIRAIDNGISDRRIETILYDASKIGKIAKEVGYLKAVASKYDFIVLESNAEYLAEIALGNTHGGIIAIAGERTIPYLSTELLKPQGFYVMIQGIEDPYNFGYSIRSLYACGCDGIILGERNWMSAAGIVARSSAGASEEISMFRASDEDCVDIFKSLGYNLVCADERTENLLGTTNLPYPILLIVGGERRGISRALLDKCDTKVKIPYAREFRASLSAASATTMFAYEIMRQNMK